MEAALREHFPEGARWTTPEGGYFYWVDLPEQIDTAALLPQAAERGVPYVNGRDFSEQRRRSSLRLAFSAVPPDQIAEGVARLGALFSRSSGTRRRLRYTAPAATRGARPYGRRRAAASALDQARLPGRDHLALAGPAGRSGTAPRSRAQRLVLRKKQSLQLTQPSLLSHVETLLSGVGRAVPSAQCTRSPGLPYPALPNEKMRCLRQIEFTGSSPCRRGARIAASACMKLVTAITRMRPCAACLASL